MNVMPAGVSERYDVYPSSEQSPGDIWINLPSLGFGHSQTLLSIVISPACDLANCKTESITYLPIVSLEYYLCSASSIIELRSELNAVLSSLGCPSIDDDPQRTNLPSAADLELAKTKVEELAASGRSKADELSRIERARAGLALFVAMRGGELRTAERYNLVKQLVNKKRLSDIASKLIGNQALSTHYLPPDGQPTDISVIPRPSLVLLRYPLSVPTSLIESARHTPASAWPTTISSMAASEPAAAYFGIDRPLKIGALKPRFTADLLTRFVSLFVRLGSPDLPAGHARDVLASHMGIVP